MLLYEHELTPYLSQSKNDVLAYANTLVESHNANCYQMANELSFMMRRAKRFDEAVEIAQMAFSAEPTLERLNLYFVAVVDQGDITTIRRLNDITDDFLSKHENTYQKHLFATWLKAANKLTDSNMFQYVYSQIPMEEKNQNSYIISQYYVYKNRLGQYEDVCKHYEQLPPHMKNSFYVKRYYDTARQRLGYTHNPNVRYRVSDSSTTHVVEPDVTAASIPDAPQDDREKKIFIVYGGDPVNLSLIKTLLGFAGVSYVDLAEKVKTGSTIIEAFEREANDTDFAIVLFTPENEGVNDVWYPRMNVVFEYGYFMARLGRENVCMLWQENGKNLDLPSDLSGIYRISMDKGTWHSELGAALKNAGFHVTF